MIASWILAHYCRYGQPSTTMRRWCKCRRDEMCLEMISQLLNDSGSFRFDFIDVYIYMNIHMQVHIMDIYFFCLYHRTFLVTIYSHRILDAHHYDHLLLLHVHICFRSYSFSLFPLHHHPHYFRHCQPIYLMYPNVIFCRHSITPSRIEDQYCW